MDKLNFDVAVNSSAFIEKTGQIRSAIRATAQEMEDQEQKISASFQQIADEASASAAMMEITIKGIQEQISVAIASLSKLDAENQVRLTNLQNAANEQTGTSQGGESVNGEISSRENLSADINNQYKELANLDAELSNCQQKIASGQSSIFEGVSSGLDGLSGAFSAATSMLELFSIENDSLKEVMQKVQSAIAITNGLQEVNTALSKESAFQINVVGRLKLWWRNITLQAASAQGIASASASAGTVVNLGLAGSFRAIGLAIKSIPVIGWILAGISALIGLYSFLSSETKEQNVEQEEMNKSIREFNESVQNSAAKPVATIELLSAKFKALGSDIEAQKKFIRDHKKEFDDLGVSINNVKDAQQLLIDNKEKFVEAQIAKAISLVYEDKVKEEAKKYVEAQNDLIHWTKMVEVEDKKSVTANGNTVMGRRKPSSPKEYDLMHTNDMLTPEGYYMRPVDVKKRDAQRRFDESSKNMETLGYQSLNESKRHEDIMAGFGLSKKKPDPKKGNDAEKQAKEAHDKLMELLAKQEAEKTRFIEDSQNRIAQSDIETKDDGSDKTFKQLELNQKKEKQNLENEIKEIKRQRTERAKEIFEANEDYEIASGSKTERGVFNESGVYKEDIEQENNTRSNNLKTKQLNERLAYYASEREAMDEHLKNYETYIEKRKAIIALGESKKEGKDKEETELIDKETNKSLATLDVNEVENATAFENLFSDIKEHTVKDMRTIVSKAEEALKFIEGGNWDAGKGTEFGISKESFDALEGTPEKVEEIKKSIKGLNEQADAGDTALNKMGIGFEHLFATKGDPEKLKKALGEIEGGMNEVIQSTKFFSDCLSNLGDSFGNDTFSGIADGMNVAMDAVGGAMSGAKAGAAFGPWGAAAGAAIGLVSSLSSSLAKLHDARNEKNIQAIQKQIEVLEKSYGNLGESLDRAFSSDASELIDQQNTLLEQQKVLIQNQIAEEESKKKTDKGRIEEWQNQIGEIDKLIGENNEKKIDVIFGEDLKSSIDEFAQAYADAWTAGDDRAKSSKDLVKDMIKQMVTEAIKAASSEPMEKLRQKLAGFFSDKIISGWEREQIEKDAEDIMNDLDSQFGWADQYMKGEEEQESSSQDSTQGGFASMSQDTGDELNGRFTALQISNEEIKNSMLLVIGNLSSLCTATSDGNILLSEMRNLAIMSNGHLEDIAKYTKVMLGFGEKLDSIAYNTKSLTVK